MVIRLMVLRLVALIVSRLSVINMTRSMMWCISIAIVEVAVSIALIQIEIVESMVTENV